MSLRPMICGFDLGKVRSLFGSADPAVIAAIESEFERRADQAPSQYDDAFRSSFRTALRTAVNHGVPFPDLEVEREPHVELATLMAAHGQQLLGTDSDCWNFSGFSEACDGGITVFSDTEDDLLGLLFYGRPLFGKQFDTSWGFYGYMSHEEVQRLRASLRSVDDEDEPLSDLAQDLAVDMSRWCDELLAANKDLWCCWG